jgi:hypothetical protein
MLLSFVVYAYITSHSSQSYSSTSNLKIQHTIPSSFSPWFIHPKYPNTTNVQWQRPRMHFKKSCHVHDRVRFRKTHLKDNLPNKTRLLCNRAFCVDHKETEEGVCEINHESYYRNHPGDQKILYRMYEE